MKDKFLPLYGDLYRELWCVHYGVDLEHERIYTAETPWAFGKTSYRPTSLLRP